MITIKNIKSEDGSVNELNIRSPTSLSIDAKERLFNLPAIIDVDTQCNFLSANLDSSWEKQALFLLRNGITTTFNGEAISPNIAESQTASIKGALTAKIPLNIHFFAEGTQPPDFNQIGKNKAFFKGIKTAVNLVNTPLKPFKNALERIFQIAAQEDLIVIIDLMQDQLEASKQRKASLAAATLAIELTEKYSAQLCLKHVRTKEELALIQSAKQKNLLIYAETAYPHLFINEMDVSPAYKSSAMPFFPTTLDQKALWAALNNQIIDMLGSGGHLFKDEEQATAAQLFLPTLFTAYQEKKLRLDTLIAVTHINAENIFQLPANKDVVLVDLTTRPASAQPIKPRGCLSNLVKQPLIGWPTHVIAQGEMFSA